VNRLQKAGQFVATCGGDIIWLIGHRSDNRFRVGKNTRHILKLTCIGEQ
jgi:tRNA(Ile)-lysidine synthase